MVRSEPDQIDQLIATLANNLINTDKAFVEVGDSLRTLVYRVPPEYVQNVINIANEWGVEYVNFNKAKDLSKTVAKDALITLDGYLTSVLPDLKNESTGVEQKKRIIDSFVSNLKDDSDKEEDLSQVYITIHHAVGYVIPSFDNVFENDTFRRKSEEYYQLKKEIDDMQAESDRMNLQLMMTEEEARRALEIYQITMRIRDRYFELMDVVERTRVAKVKLSFVKPSLDTISTQVGAFASVWATLRNDCQQLYDKLNIAADDMEPDFWPLFIDRVEASIKAYTKLRKGLETYLYKVGKNSMRLLAI